MAGAGLHTHTKRSHWWIIFLLGLLTIVLGTVGYFQADAPDEGEGAGAFFDAFYRSIELLVAHAAEYGHDRNMWIEIARWTGVATFLGTAWLLIVSRLKQEVQLLLLKSWQGHAIICGLSAKAVALIESMKHKDGTARIVVIDPAPPEDLLHHCQELNICVLKGDPAKPAQLRTARAAQAAEILALAAEDETNIRVAAEVRAFRHNAAALHPDGTREAVTPAVCRAHIASSHLPEALQKWTDAQIETSSGGTPLETSTLLRFFDVFDIEARRVLTGAGPAGGVPLDGPGIPAASHRKVHVVVLGMGRMGSAVVVRAAKMGHFANGSPLRITVIDRDAARLRAELLFRYPVLAETGRVCDLRFQALSADSPEARHFIEQCAADRDTVLQLFVCLDSNARAVEMALRLWEMVAEHPHSHVHVRITTRAAVGPILKRNGARINVFGTLEESCTVDAIIDEQMETVARAIHTEFVAARHADGSAAERRGDPVLAPWEKLREDFRESNRQQADHMGVKMRTIGCRLVSESDPGEAVVEFSTVEIETLAELEHRRWNAERLLSGWRFGEQPDKARRVTNYLVPYAQLSEDIKDYDREVVRKLPRWLRSAGLKAVR